MTRRISTILLSILTTIGLAFAGASPASAGGETALSGDCTYDSPTINKVGSYLRVTTDADGRLIVRGDINNDGLGRTWDWKFRHNGSLSDSGTAVGNTAVVRTMVNFNGIDEVKWIFDNRANTIHCVATINYSG